MSAGTWLLEFASRTKRRTRDLPDNLRLAAIGAWRGRERGMAVFAGVFLSSLVITTVLAYGVGLSQVFFQETLKSNIFDAKIEFNKAPSDGNEFWSNNTSMLQDVCVELSEMDEFSDCTVVFGKKGMHSPFDFGNEDVFKSMHLLVEEVNSSDSRRQWEGMSFDYQYTTGPPIANTRAITFLGPEAFDGVLADRLSANIIHEMGEWVSPEEIESQRGVYLPSDVASEAQAEVGDNLNWLNFSYTTDTKLPGGMDEEDCEGDILIAPETGFMHCQVTLQLENLTVLGIYEPWPQANPTLPANPIYASWTSLNETQRVALIDFDHIYFGVTIERSLLPTSSTSDAAEWLDALSRDVEKQTFADGQIELYYNDIISSSILFVNIFLGIIQAFDYILMVPIVILSLAVLVYGLILSLEQRRREISIHRVIGATSQGLRGMIMLELAVMGSLAWFVGYILAMASVPLVLASVGFMEFSSLGFTVDPRLSLFATFFTALATLGLALVFGRTRARDFMEMEIDEGVSRVRSESKPKVWLHWVMFLTGMIAVIDTWMEMNPSSKWSEDGIIDSWFLEGLLGIFGPFLLWIGGALLLGRLGAAGPRIMQFFFGRSPLLSDVKRGLKGSGSTESVNRLAVIMLLTLSIVTLAAVQGYTGTMVDERTASATVGSDLQVITENEYTAAEVEAAIAEISGGKVTAMAVTVESLTLIPDDSDPLNAYVLLDESEDVLDWYEQSIPGEDVGEALAAYRNGGFSAGQDAAYALDLWGSGRQGSSDEGDVLLSPNSKRTANVTFIWEDIQFNFSSMSLDVTPHNTTLRYIGTHEFIPGVPTDEMERSLIIGESGLRALKGDDAVNNLKATTWIVRVDGVSGDNLQALRVNIEADSRFASGQDWVSAHEDVERNGGLIFGTPGLLSLQFVVASIAAVASAFVFLSLVLNQRQKELAVLQAIGASPNQIIRLVLFEILSIIVVSMVLGVALGMGLALSFNGMFEVFGFIFQIFGGSSTIIARELVWPWLQLGIVALAVFAAVVLALLVTTRKALRSDLASVLKGE
ncbi:MAG: FtsX-like permease family protein [Candidatus Thalassarchaeaceae archaeon]|nr:FtsX-like permease family protein [Candidatus Thalassarchaeaceae archaeon]